MGAIGAPENPAFIGVNVEQLVRDAIDARARTEQSSRSVVARRILSAWASANPAPSTARDVNLVTAVGSTGFGLDDEEATP